MRLSEDEAAAEHNASPSHPIKRVDACLTEEMVRDMGVSDVVVEVVEDTVGSVNRGQGPPQPVPAAPATLLTVLPWQHAMHPVQPPCMRRGVSHTHTNKRLGVPTKDSPLLAVVVRQRLVRVLQKRDHHLHAQTRH